MSQENVEIARALFEAWNAGTRMSFVTCTTPMSSCGRWKVGRSRGHSLAGRRSCAGTSNSARPGTPKPLESISDFIDIGDRVAVRQLWRGVGQGPDSVIEFTGVTTLRKGRVVAVEFFWDHAEALETLGLSE
jgi:ketosteroid isomerase-like protein